MFCDLFDNKNHHKNQIERHQSILFHFYNYYFSQNFQSEFALVMNLCEKCKYKNSLTSNNATQIFFSKLLKTFIISANIHWNLIYQSQSTFPIVIIH